MKQNGGEGKNRIQPLADPGNRNSFPNLKGDATDDNPGLSEQASPGIGFLATKEATGAGLFSRHDNLLPATLSILLAFPPSSFDLVG